MFWSKNKKNRYTPSKPQFYYIKVGFKGLFIARICFPDETMNLDHEIGVYDALTSSKLYEQVCSFVCLFVCSFA